MRTLALFYVYCLLYKLFNATSAIILPTEIPPGPPDAFPPI